MTDLKPGDYGRFDFILRKKGLETSFSLHATVIELDGKYVLLKDNDYLEYLPKRVDIKNFKEEKAPI